MRPNRRTLAALLAVVTVAAPVGIEMRNHKKATAAIAAQETTPPHGKSGPTAPDTAGAGVSAPVGDVGRTEAGARRAVIDYIALTEEVFDMTPDQAAELQRTISTRRSAGRLAADLERTLEELQALVPEGITVHVAPMAIRSVRSGDGWAVAVWYVQVGIYGQEIAVEMWETATYQMVWEENRWLIDDMASVPGPIPTRLESATATPVDQLIADLAGFDDEELRP